MTSQIASIALEKTAAKHETVVTVRRPSVRRDVQPEPN
jgi:hypothetical protein